MNNTEAELESFRQQWREEVTAKVKGKAPAQPTTWRSSEASSSKAPASRSNAPTVPAHTRQRSVEGDDEIEPHSYTDLEDKQHGSRLGDTGHPVVAGSSDEPQSALEHYEKAVEKESAGNLGESLRLYRKAFRLDENVHQTYKNKHFPAPSFQPPKPKPQDPNPSDAPVTVPNTAHHSLQGFSSSFQTLIQEFSCLTIQGEPPPTDLSPPPACPIASIPDEILVEILLQLAIQDVASYVRLAQVCKRLAYLVITEDRVWKRICLGHEFGFEAMKYAWVCKVNGKPLGDDDEGGYILGTEEDKALQEEEQASLGRKFVSKALTPLLVPNPYSTYRALWRVRPRIRFNGCYISTVNYTRPGASSATFATWNSPILIVTYYRYLRFFRDGRCISLLTTSEPADVVPFLHPEHMHKNHGNLPSAPMKDALWGRWRLSGPTPPASALEDGKAVEVEQEGTLHVETEGATPKYLFKMAFTIGSSGKRARNNKLVWEGFWNYNKLTDDWGEFALRHYRPYYWSRVKSYGMGL